MNHADTFPRVSQELIAYGVPAEARARLLEAARMDVTDPQSGAGQGGRPRGSWDQAFQAAGTPFNDNGANR